MRLTSILCHHSMIIVIVVACGWMCCIRSEEYRGSIIRDNVYENLDPIDWFFNDLYPRFIGQRPNNENGTLSQYKEYTMTDVSNDDAARLTGQEIITRSGFKYEMYQSVADDGYITYMTRLINPLADRSKLKYPPIIIEHGGTIDPTAYIIASSIQHHPEIWPRSQNDAPMTSWNRSLAFVLSNWGHDVWLAETRGSSDFIRGRITSRAWKTYFEGANNDKNMTKAESLLELAKGTNFWDFSQDDIIAHELKSHMDTVMDVTNATKVSLMTFSLSTPTSLAFLSIRPDYAEKIQGFVSMAPITSGEGVNSAVRLALEIVCPLWPDKFGTMFVSESLLRQPTRELVLALAADKKFRYSIFKAAITPYMGASAKYQSLLDLNVLGHMLRSLSFREFKQMCQQMGANRLQKYDFGPIMNQFFYKSFRPPIYDLSNLALKDWIIVDGANDALSTNGAIEHLIRIVNPKPSIRISVPGFNHLDLITGYGNDYYVNLPILNYLDRVSYDPSQEEETPSESTNREVRSSARGFDLKSLFQPRFGDETKSKEAYSKVDQEAKHPNPINLDFLGDFKRYFELLNPAKLLQPLQTPQPGKKDDQLATKKETNNPIEGLQNLLGGSINMFDPQKLFSGLLGGSYDSQSSSNQKLDDKLPNIIVGETRKKD